MSKIDVIGPGYNGRSNNINASRCVNIYPEISGQDSKSVSALVGTPGTERFVNTNLPKARGMRVFNEKIYFVAENKLYSVDASGIVSSQLGNNLETSIGRVSMADNGLAPTGGDELAIADGSNIYIYNVVSGAFNTISIVAKTICFIDGYFVADSGGFNFRTSDLYDGTTWNALNVGTAESEPDKLVAVYNNHGQLWLFGEETTEVFYNRGTGNPVFARLSGGVMDTGCAARYSLAQGSNTIFWLGNNRNDSQGEFAGVCMAEGYRAKIISSPAINYTISNYSVINDAYGYCYTDEGHEFYVLVFPTANATWSYDATTNLWHERSTYQDDPYKVVRHVGNNYVYFNGKHYVSDYESGNIYRMGSDIYDDNGQQLVSFRTFLHLADKENLKRVFYKKFQLDMETGVGDGSSPTQSFFLQGNATVGTGPFGMVSDGTNIWVVNQGATTVSKVDVSTLQELSTVDVGGTPTEITFDGTDLWIARSNAVVKIDLSTETVVATITASGAYAIHFDETSVWCSSTSGYIYKINISTNLIEATINVGSDMRGVTSNNNFVWVGNYANGDLLKVNPTTNVVDTTYSIGTQLHSVYAHGDHVWCADQSANEVYKFNTITGVVDATISVGTLPYGITSYDKYIIVANYTSANLTIIDSNTNIVNDTITIGVSPPYGAYYAFGKIWISSYDQNAISKIISNDVYSSEADPQAELSWSDDGGHIWKGFKNAPIGKQGEYEKRVQWHRLGNGRDRLFRVAISSAVKKILIAGHLDAEVGMY